MTCLAGLAALLTSACGSDGETAVSVAPTSVPVVGPQISVDMSAVETFTIDKADHTNDDVDYPQSPPVGGPHADAWQNCGVYDEPVADENAVHSLQHGAVWLAYDQGLGADEVEAVRTFARGQSHVLVSPYPDLAAGEAVVATAWGVQLRLDSVDDARLAAFVAMYQQGPTTPEPGATCSGAKGDPIE